MDVPHSLQPAVDQYVKEVISKVLCEILRKPVTPEFIVVRSPRAPRLIAEYAQQTLEETCGLSVQEKEDEKDDRDLVVTGDLEQLAQTLPLDQKLITEVVRKLKASIVDRLMASHLGTRKVQFSYDGEVDCRIFGEAIRLISQETEINIQVVEEETGRCLCAEGDLIQLIR